MEIIRREIEERLSSPDARKGDLLDHFISDTKNEAFLTSKFISYMIMVLLIAGFDAVSSAMTIAIKYLSENPDVVQKLTVNCSFPELYIAKVLSKFAEASYV